MEEEIVIKCGISSSEQNAMPFDDLAMAGFAFKIVSDPSPDYASSSLLRTTIFPGLMLELTQMSIM